MKAAGIEVAQDDAVVGEVISDEIETNDAARPTTASVCRAAHQRYSRSGNPLHIWEAVLMCTMPDVAPMPLPDFVSGYLHNVASELLATAGDDPIMASKALKLTTRGRNAFKDRQSDARAIDGALLHDELTFQGLSSSEADERVREQFGFKDTSSARRLVGQGHVLLRHVPVPDC
jgi:hypothetical protein